MVAAAPIARRRPGAATPRRPAVDPRIAGDTVPTMRVLRRETPAAEAGAMPREASATLPEAKTLPPAVLPVAAALPPEDLPVAAALPPPGRIGEGTAPTLADPAGHRWIAALTAALLLHGLAVWALAPTVVPDAGEGAAATLAIDFLALDAEDDVDATAGAVASPPTETKVADKPESEPPPETTASTVAPVVVPEPPQPEAVLPPEPVRPPEITPPRPVEAPPAIRKKPVEARRKPIAPVERRSPPPRAAAAPGATAERHSGGAPVVGAAEMAAAREGELKSWRAAVLAALAAAKTYPEEARAQGRGGRAAVRFTIRRDGGVDGVALAASSGVATLDAATLAMPRRARFPAMPAAAGSSQSFTAGVRYDLR